MFEAQVPPARQTIFDYWIQFWELKNRRNRPPSVGVSPYGGQGTDQASMPGDDVPLDGGAHAYTCKYLPHVKAVPHVLNNVCAHELAPKPAGRDESNKLGLVFCN